MIDILIPAADLGCYQAHKFIESRLDAIGLSAQNREYLFCNDPLSAATIVLRIEHRTAGILGKLREIPAIIQGHDYHFCVRVSPVKRGPGPQRKRIPDTDLDGWRARHLDERCGVKIEKIFMHIGKTYCAKTDNNGFWLPDVVMVGRLSIADPTKTIAALQTGIGRHRAFGFGLLQLFPT